MRYTFERSVFVSTAVIVSSAPLSSEASAPAVSAALRLLIVAVIASSVSDTLFLSTIPPDTVNVAVDSVTRYPSGAAVSLRTYVPSARFFIISAVSFV